MIKERLIQRYIMGKAGRSERRQVVDWINESADNLEQYSRMRAKFVFDGFPNDILPEKKPLRPVIVNIAAALSIPLLAGAIYLLMAKTSVQEQLAESSRRIVMLEAQTPGESTYIANPGTKSIVVLPDSSIVRLNGDSRLVVPNHFGTEIRELRLSGEGYFDVRHHEDWPMHIHTPKGVTVKVLGTTFDLSAYENDDNVKLTLIEGRVIMHEEKTGSEHEVRPNQEISISDIRNESVSTLPAPPTIKKADVEKNTGWVRGELIFDNTPMTEIIKQLERWYGVNIHVVNEDILRYRLTATFSTESITRVLDLIKFSSMLQYEINGNEVYIKKVKS